MTQAPFRKSSGFTLIELLIGVAILGILLSLAVPAFTDYLRNTRMRNHADAIHNALSQTRAEAVRRNTYIRFQLLNAMDSSCAVVASTAAGANFWAVTIGDPAGRCNKEIFDPTPSQIGGAPPHDELGPNYTDLWFDAIAQPPFLLAKGIRESQQSEFQAVMTLYDQTNSTALPGTAIAPEDVAVLCFAPSGQLARYHAATVLNGVKRGNCGTSKNPASTWIVGAAIDINPAPGMPACSPAGTSRCLRVEVRPGGESRLCDRGVPVLNPAAPVGADPRGCSW
jgi:prepilin-type N-terminal cleavage/methylation domain-containing protein